MLNFVRTQRREMVRKLEVPSTAYSSFTTLPVCARQIENYRRRYSQLIRLLAIVFFHCRLQPLKSPLRKLNRHSVHLSASNCSINLYLLQVRVHISMICCNGCRCDVYMIQVATMKLKTATVRLKTTSSKLLAQFEGSKLEMRKS